MSDVHLSQPGDEKTFASALEYFRSRDVDGVLISGDIADGGRISEFKLAVDAWFKVFPGGRYPDGRVCEQLFIYGNHCIDFAAQNEQDGIGFGDNRRRVWEELLHEEYRPIWLKRVKGVPIVGAHWFSWAGTNGALAEFFAAHAAEFDPALPLVFTQHAHPKDTCMGAWAWGHDNGESTKILSRFPNAVAFTGHSHYSFTDERSVWQGAFTSVNAGCLKYSSTDYALRDNMPGNASSAARDNLIRHTPRLDTSDGRQGLLVEFYDDRIEIERREFFYGKRLGPDWIVPFPAGREDYSFAARAARRAAPEFASGAGVTVAEVRECVREGGERRLMEVSFPAALAVDGCRPYEYEITAVLEADDADLVLAQRRVMDSCFYLPEGVGADRRNFVRFDIAELRSIGNCRFTVRPIECFGRKGAPIVSDTVFLPGPPQATTST